ncbi:MAG: antibiotic biosynthesis monooxygenase [Candidatus Eremiobacteraeota bacterium]|nr:antibiotic biosynthesis monooxygenase [Candidatus Eremiobacteraeota bacterium]
MIVLTVTYTIQSGREQEALEHFRALKQESLKEPGNIAYLIHQSPADARRFFLYEQYLDETALDEHRASRHFTEHASNGIMKIMESRQPETYALID